MKTIVKTHGDFIGYIEGDTFVKEVRGSRHQLRQPPAWALDADSFDKIIKPSVRRLVIIDRETSARYESTIENFLQWKGEINRGHGKQYFLALIHWNKK